MCVCVYMYGYGYGYLYVYVYMHMSTFIIILMDALNIYLIGTYIHCFVFKSYTPLSTF